MGKGYCFHVPPPGPSGWPVFDAGGWSRRTFSIVQQGFPGGLMSDDGEDWDLHRGRDWNLPM